MAQTGEVHIHVHIHEGADEARVSALEETVANEVEQLSELKANFTDFVADVNAKVAALEEAQGNFDVAGQAAFDDLKASVDAAQAALGDADGSDTPPVEPGGEPDQPENPGQ